MVRSLSRRCRRVHPIHSLNGNVVVADDGEVPLRLVGAEREVGPDRHLVSTAEVVVTHLSDEAVA